MAEKYLKERTAVVLSAVVTGYAPTKYNVVRAALASYGFGLDEGWTPHMSLWPVYLDENTIPKPIEISTFKLIYGDLKLFMREVAASVEVANGGPCSVQLDATVLTTEGRITLAYDGTQGMAQTVSR